MHLCRDVFVFVCGRALRAGVLSVIEMSPRRCTDKRKEMKMYYTVCEHGM